MTCKGSSTVETALVFPMFIILIVVLLLLLVSFIKANITEPKTEDDFIQYIHHVDSLQRKVEILDEIIK